MRRRQRGEAENDIDDIDDRLDGQPPGEVDPKSLLRRSAPKKDIRVRILHQRVQETGDDDKADRKGEDRLAEQPHRIFALDPVHDPARQKAEQAERQPVQPIDVDRTDEKADRVADKSDQKGRDGAEQISRQKADGIGERDLVRRGKLDAEHGVRRDAQSDEDREIGDLLAHGKGTKSLREHGKNLPDPERSVKKQCAERSAAILATDALRHRRETPFVCEQRPVSQHLTRLSYSAFNMRPLYTFFCVWQAYGRGKRDKRKIFQSPRGPPSFCPLSRQADRIHAAIFERRCRPNGILLPLCRILTAWASSFCGRRSSSSRCLP